jgi:hypothetical protein
MPGLPIFNDMGFKKTLLYVSGFMLATGGPITMFSASDLAAGLKRSWFASPAVAASSQPTAAPVPTASEVPAAPSNPALEPLAASAAMDPLPLPSLSEVLRFDVTVEWVMQRWPRVSTGLPHVQLQGYRVPLVTGTSVADLAGSLTYYFNPQQQVQRITFRGTTGDPTALMTILAGRYRFARRLTNDPGVVLYEAVDSSNRPTGSIKIRSAKVIKANQPYARFEVDLMMDRSE